MLKINDLNVSYGASQVLFGVDLQANLGEISCVLGRNGVGKTSLVRAVAGRHFATSGQVLWEGEDIRDRDPASRARQGLPTCRREEKYLRDSLSKKTSK